MPNGLLPQHYCRPQASHAVRAIAVSDLQLLLVLTLLPAFAADCLSIQGWNFE